MLIKKTLCKTLCGLVATVVIGVLGGCDGKPEVNEFLADVDGDGKKDVVSYMRTNYLSYSKTSHDIYVALNSNGSFTESKKVLHLKNMPREICVEDLDGDGIRDISYIMASSRPGLHPMMPIFSWGMYLAKGNGDGTFQDAVKIKHYKQRPYGLIFNW